MKKINKFFRWMPVWVFIIFLFLPTMSYTATMEDYCLIPPYVKRDVSVNIMVLIDNSEDMLAPAHIDNPYCPSKPVGNTNCWDGTKYYKEYIGHFPSNACYNPDVGNKFKYQRQVNYSAYPDTGCPSGEFNGNILNWATMSRYTIAKKVLTGEASTAIAQPFEIEGKQSLWEAAFGGVNYRNYAGCRWAITSSASDVLSLTVTEPGAPGSCRYPKGATWVVRIDPTLGIEVRTGILQEFTDVNPKDSNFDKGSARFGITIFSQTGVTISEYIPPGNYEPFINTVKTMGTRANNDLATAHKTIDDYFITPGLVSRDPYKGCASWESPPCVQGVAVPCRKSAILMITTGTDVSGTTYATLPDQCSAGETRPLVRNACYVFNTDLRTAADLPGKQNLETYVIQTFGTAAGGPEKATTLEQCASATGNTRALCEAAVYGGGAYYSAGTDDLADTIRQALQDILRRAASGTAASVLASGEGSGANLVQAVFYPRTPKLQLGGIFDREISWIGRLTNYWYYVDPFFGSSAIYEDNASSGVLNLSNDNKLRLYFDTANEKTMAERLTGTDPSPVEIGKLKTLWEAGVELWKRTSARSIKTTIGGGLIDFSTTNASTLRLYLDPGDINGDAVVNDADATRLIEYIHGQDFSNLRSRTVAVDLNGDGVISGAEESAEVWKLGDVLNSTPRISSWIPLNTYDQVYSDTTYKSYIDSAGYKNRGMVFAGGNDGMLHAIKLGTLELITSGGPEKARLTGTDLGKELWAFIPKNALPYLKYIMDPEYCHVYSVDLSPYIFDASIGGDPGDTKDVSSWRTILIGGMRFGGACRNLGSTCTDCVKTPVTDLGYSSYFALDVTDQNNPQLLWEFSNESLGFATTGPAVVRVGNTTKNGKWFVVFGSGPTGPIATTNNQFMGRSDQNLRFFVLDLKTGNLLRTIDTGIQYAFAGSMLNSTLDTDLDYQDDAVYIGYIKRTGSGSNYTWTDGGVGRLLTKEDINPNNWVWSEVIDGIGPVTASVTRLQSNKKHILWLYFGTGRYYFEQEATVDDPDGQRKIFGVKEPCFTSENTLNTTCTTLVNSGDLTNATSISSVPSEETANSEGFKGWYINLDASGNYTYNEGGTNFTRNYRAERVITDPLSTTTGLVFFTTYKPYNDVCAYGGKSFLWAARYTTGGAPGALLKGVALLQVSTGSIEQVNLSTAFTEAGGRKTSALEGVPPTGQGLSILSTPPPIKRVIHMRER